MKVITKFALIVVAATLISFVSYAQLKRPEVLWLDFDMNNIPEPKARESGYYEYFFEGQLVEQTKQDLDVPRWLRKAGGNPKQASNVNELDEVPDSSWYTNRHHIHRMSIPDLQRGPNRGSRPDFTTVVVTKAKTSGVTPGMMVKDANGQTYLVKFDGMGYLNLLSGAEVISTKIMYAAGYNVPENYVAYIDPKNLSIGDKVEILDETTGKQRPLTQEDIQKILRKAAVTPDGRYRVMASKLLPGKPKGPFTQVGLRGDDPNDLIPHEHRRELRGTRVIASWINNWDLKEPQSLDMYVEENGCKFLRHYLLDFGSSLGANDIPTEYFHGHEYGVDLGNITKEIVTLGFYDSPNEKRAQVISPEIGNFTSYNFDPGSWKQTYSSVMFDNMTDEDAFWATRVILSFNEGDLRSIIETAEYSDPQTNDYMLRTLLDRQRMVARYWLAKTDGLTDFAIQRTTNGVNLTFTDLMVANQLGSSNLTTYTFQVKGKSYQAKRMTTTQRAIGIDRETLAAAIEHASRNTPIEVMIWTNRTKTISKPVKVYFNWDPSLDKFSVRRISRG
jgi:hypothetical protein